MNELAYYTEQLDKREGVMDWMTDEWVNETADAAEAAFSKATLESECDDLAPNEETFIPRYIARAAARKVVEWEDGWCEEHIPPRRGIPMLRSEQRRVCEECQAALRQEVGL